MTEQLAFHEVGRERRTVDGDEGLLRPLAPAVDGAGQLTLAGAGFAEEKDVGVGAGHLSRGFQHRHHRRALGRQAIARAAHLAFQDFQAGGELAHFQLFGRRHAQLVRAAGFDQVIGGTGLHGVHRRIHRRMRGDDHHTHPGRLHAHLRQYVQAVVLAQAQVEEAQVEHLPLQDRLGLGRAARRGDAVALVLEAVTESAQDGGFVIHQENSSLVLACLFHDLAPFPRHRKLVQESSCKLHVLFLQALQHASTAMPGLDANSLIDRETLPIERLAQALRYSRYLKARRSFHLL
ncbi:hypothetical protein D9M68_477840 [compost metagenome]